MLSGNTIGIIYLEYTVLLIIYYFIKTEQIKEFRVTISTLIIFQNKRFLTLAIIICLWLACCAWAYFERDFRLNMKQIQIFIETNPIQILYYIVVFKKRFNVDISY